jgi:hypothetical protein
MVAPVCGLRPSLAALLEIEKDPNPTRATLPPLARDEATDPVKASRAFFAAALEIPASLAIASINSDLFIIKQF